VLLQNADDLLFRKAATLHALVLAGGQNELQAGLRPRGKVTAGDFMSSASTRCSIRVGRRITLRSSALRTARRSQQEYSHNDRKGATTAHQSRRRRDECGHVEIAVGSGGMSKQGSGIRCSRCLGSYQRRSIIGRSKSIVTFKPSERADSPADLAHERVRRRGPALPRFRLTCVVAVTVIIIPNRLYSMTIYPRPNAR
jgi:hypothetical protein